MSGTVFLLPYAGLAYQTSGRINWPFHIFFMVFFLALGSVVLYLDIRRRSGFTQLAKKLGLEFRRSADEALAIRLNLFEILREGGRQGVSQMLSGKVNGKSCWAFNFFHRNKDPFAQAKGGYGCVLFRLNAPLAPFRIVPQAMYTRLDSWDYERVFLVPWPDDSPLILAKKLAPIQQVLDDPVYQWHQLHPDCLVAVEEEFVLIAWSGEIKPTNVQDQLKHAAALLTRLKRD